MRSISRKWLALAILIAISAAAFSLSAQQNPENPCLVRKVHVQVEDQVGNPITGLSADKFKAAIDKDEIAIRRVDHGIPIANVLLLLDTSGSRRTDFEIRSNRLLETELINQSSRGTRFAMVEFADETWFDQDFTSDRRILSAAFEKYASDHRGASNIYDSVIASVEHIRHLGLSPEGSLIVLITDGEDNNSRNKLDKALAILSNSGVRLFTIGTAAADPRKEIGTNKARKIHEALGDLAKASGGNSVWLWEEDPPKAFLGVRGEFRITKNFGNIHEIVGELIREMTSGYELEMVLPAAISKPIRWELRVPPFDSMNSVIASVHYSETLYPCTDMAKK
jgi:Mg-chelatase subunit ChlD